MVGQGLREVVGGSSFVGFRAGPRLQARKRDREVPGCLTGESEERETWTAESLRAASSNGEGFGFFRKRAAVEETSAVLRFKVHRAGWEIGRSGGPRQCSGAQASLRANV